jgi:serine-type D-Ala-D-Ala carboxypeptidase (penicillin-binding protein 5/6)
MISGVARRVDATLWKAALALTVTLAVVMTVWGSAVGGSGAATRWRAAVTADPSAIPPPQRLVQSIAETYTIPGAAPTLTWPSGGQAAVEVEGVGMLGSFGDVSTPVPIASVTKTMTAYQVLLDHPLTAQEQGPTITISQQDADLYNQDIDAGDSAVLLKAGEELTERQALEALLLASADDVAIVLAEWDAGSVGAFLAKMNATAASLGMTHTTYADPAGLDAATVSTATDQILLAQTALLQPALAAVVDESSATIPVAGTIHNINTLLGQDGVVGIKTGSTDAAGACLLFAAQVAVDGLNETVIGAVFGQPFMSTGDFLSAALGEADTLVTETERALTTWTVAAPGTPVAVVRQAGQPDVRLGAVEPVTVVGWPGLTFRIQVYGNAGSAGIIASRPGTVQPVSGAALAPISAGKTTR